ncbi:helix-turn-helix domain-containing protein [Clostridium sp. FP2]|uniref:PucR family transcriptional regulator n=1 Tax=Clostridium TaxID=1485 RepID=UPI0013E98DC8|nr:MULTISPECIES: helix-turn-helix domain-containing protein [Clostridium]MBW9156860.1 helix-turn-helix domain-containing protein [Clostridium tagluense]MBZ9622023.1 helix-turn-helix domain-containing protein [Clostridium sp. FP2]WLC66338.1 helix-turn-helix domain-containing protein [Clostridium tagluense]
MSINFNKLREYFIKKTKGAYFDIEPDINFIDTELVTEEKIVYLKDYVYVANTSIFKGNLDKINDACFILINDDCTKLEKYIDNKLKIIEINQNENILEIFNEVKCFFRRDIKYNQFKISLLEAFLSGEGLYKIINTASKLIGNPLIVIDLSFKVLASSPIENITDLLWMDNVKKGYCSYEFIAELTKLETLKKGRQTKRPFIVTCPISPIEKIVFKIEINNKTIGNILLLQCEKQVSPDDYDYLILISEIISKELGKKQFYKNTKNVLSEEILYDLLENTIENKEIIKERLKNCSLVFSKHIFVMVIDISNFELRQSIYSRYLSTALLNLFPISNSIYYNGAIVIIDDREEYIENENKTESIKKFLLENNLKMGISSEFSSIEDCSIYYHQAIRSLEIGSILGEKKCVYKHEDIVPYNFIYMAKGQILKEDFYNNSIYILKKFDYTNSSELYKTLYTYLKNNHNMTKSSEELFIHRNTLRYRLQQIVNLIGIDLDKNDNSFKLYYACKSISFYKKLIDSQSK